jgi:hypothetical protein
MTDFFGIALFTIDRSIGPFVAQCTIEEHHLDELQITQHPVGAQAAITDHAFKRPSQLVLELGWSNSSRIAGLLTFDNNYVHDIYAQLRAAQVNRQPLKIVTGKYTYKNMLIQSLATTTNRKTETSLPIQMRCQEVIFAQTSTVTIPSNSVMLAPEVTGTTQQIGTQNVINANGSINVNALPLNVWHP